MAQLEFWYEFASTYSYLSAMRIETAAAARGVTVRWKPFLLGPIFRSQGWENSPFRLYPRKGDYMQRDLERICAARNLTFRLSPLFPQNGLLAARIAMIGAEEGWGAAFTREVFLMQFRDEADISDRTVLTQALRLASQDAAVMMERAQDPAVKNALRSQTESAAALAIFGAPTFITEDRELFWGDDRLDHALEWAANVRGGGASA